MLTILNELLEHHDIDSATNTFNLDTFKRLYIASMKSLIQEIVGKCSEHLKIFSVKAGELTGNALKVNR